MVIKIFICEISIIKKIYLFKFLFLGHLIVEIISKINSYTDSNSSLLTYKPLLGLYDKIMNSNSVNNKNYQNVLEKIFGNIEFVLQKILSGIVSIDASNNFNEFLLWYFLMKLIKINKH